MKDELGNSVPVMQDYYGGYGQNTGGIKMTYTPGIINEKGNFVEQAFSQLDAVELGQLSHTAKIIPNAQPCGYFMLS
jgi:putative IMPACT (imprinted ancient) family translation regulator